MKAGRSLTELAAQLETERKEKKDFVVPTTKLEFVPEGPRGRIQFDVNGTTYAPEPTALALRQIATHADIPQRYIDRMVTAGAKDKDAQELLAKNINHWFKKEPARRMVRTLVNNKQTFRAFLSDRYRPLDNGDLAEAVLPTLIKAGVQVISSEITENRFYIQAATPKIQLDIVQLMKERGIAHSHAAKPLDTDIVQAGVVISNSEVGLGRIRVEPMLWRLWCYNGAILPTAMARHHVGRRNGEIFDDASEYFTDETRSLDDRAFWSKVVDVVNGVFDPQKFDSWAEKFARTGSFPIEIGATEAIEVVAKRYDFNETEKSSVLDHLIKGGDLSVYGLVNAVTRASTDVENYDRAVELERAGGEIIELPPTMWKKLS